MTAALRALWRELWEPLDFLAPAIEGEIRIVVLPDGSARVTADYLGLVHEGDTVDPETAQRVLRASNACITTAYQLAAAYGLRVQLTPPPPTPTGR